MSHPNDFLALLRGQTPPKPSVSQETRVYSAEDGSLWTILADGTDAPVAGAGVLPNPTDDGDVLTVVEGEWAGAPGGGSIAGAARVLGPFPFAFDTMGVACLSFPIIAVNQPGGTFTIAGDHVDLFLNNPINPGTDTDYIVTGSTGNDGSYGPAGDVTLVADNTVISANGTPLPDGTADGTITAGSWGADFYTPTVDDVLLDLWIEVETAWDVVARADIGTTAGDGGGSSQGLFGAATNGSVQADSADVDGADVGGGGGLLVATQQSDLVEGVANYGYGRFGPLRFTAANPLKVWVSTNGGAGLPLDPAVSQGSASIYLVVATPSLS